jgi:hypothetical protein
MTFKSLHSNSSRYFLIVGLWMSFTLSVLAMILNRDLTGTGLIIGAILGAAAINKGAEKKYEEETKRNEQCVK